MILITSPLLRIQENKTDSENFYRGVCLYMYVHIFYYFSIYWSDTSLSPRLYQLSHCAALLQYLEFLGGISEMRPWAHWFGNSIYVKLRIEIFYISVSI